MSNLLYSAVAVVICVSVVGCGGAPTPSNNSAPQIQSSEPSDQGSGNKDESQPEKKSAGSDSR